MRRHEGQVGHHTGIWVFDLDAPEIGVVGCAAGASFAVLVAEEVLASGCKLPISVTSSRHIMPQGCSARFTAWTLAAAERRRGPRPPGSSSAAGGGHRGQARRRRCPGAPAQPWPLRQGTDLLAIRSWGHSSPPSPALGRGSWHDVLRSVHWTARSGGAGPRVIPDRVGHSSQNHQRGRHGERLFLARELALRIPDALLRVLRLSRDQPRGPRPHGPRSLARSQASRQTRICSAYRPLLRQHSGSSASFIAAFSIGLEPVGDHLSTSLGGRTGPVPHKPRGVRRTSAPRAGSRSRPDSVSGSGRDS